MSEVKHRLFSYGTCIKYVLCPRCVSVLHWQVSCGGGGWWLLTGAPLTSSLSPRQRSTVAVHPHPVKKNTVTLCRVHSCARVSTCMCNNEKVSISVCMFVCILPSTSIAACCCSWECIHILQCACK